jgi:hypothetical protein
VIPAGRPRPGSPLRVRSGRQRQQRPPQPPTAIRGKPLSRPASPGSRSRRTPRPWNRNNSPPARTIRAPRSTAPGSLNCARNANGSKTNTKPRPSPPRPLPAPACWTGSRWPGTPCPAHRPRSRPGCSRPSSPSCRTSSFWPHALGAIQKPPLCAQPITGDNLHRTSIRRLHAHWRQPALVTECHPVLGSTSRKTMLLCLSRGSCAIFLVSFLGF